MILEWKERGVPNGKPITEENAQEYIHADKAFGAIATFVKTC